MNDNITVNDGKGLLDNLGLIDTLIVDCDTLLDIAFKGKGHRIAFATKLIEMVQKLSNLRDGVENDSKSLKEQIDELNKYIEKSQKGSGKDV